jgi:triosephosphate isomerase
MRKKIVVGNWKMNLNRKEADDLVSEISQSTSLDNNTEIVFAPPFIYLDSVSSVCLSRQFFSAAAQDCSSYSNGAYTGEISAQMIDSLEVKYVIIGHSERRQNFNETDKVLNLKINQALKNNLNVIFCCGEDINQREANQHFDIIEKQLSSTVFKLDIHNFKDIIIAYEPIWAIGTGKTASSDQAQEMHSFIRSLINKRYDNKTGSLTSLLYGGSCNASNAYELFSKEDIDGGLIGGASLNSSDFISIIKSF